MFDQIISEDENGGSIGICIHFALHAGLYEVTQLIVWLSQLNQLWEECLEKFLQPDIKGREIGVQS